MQRESLPLCLKLGKKQLTLCASNQQPLHEWSRKVIPIRKTYFLCHHHHPRCQGCLDKWDEMGVGNDINQRLSLPNPKIKYSKSSTSAVDYQKNVTVAELCSAGLDGRRESFTVSQRAACSCTALNTDVKLRSCFSRSNLYTYMKRSLCKGIKVDLTLSWVCYQKLTFDYF